MTTEGRKEFCSLQHKNNKALVSILNNGRCKTCMVKYKNIIEIKEDANNWEKVYFHEPEEMYSASAWHFFPNEFINSL